MPIPASEVTPSWAPAYIEVDDLAHYLKIEDHDDDAELADAIEAASRAVDLEARRQFGRVAALEERFYTAVWDRHMDGGRWLVDIDDLMTATGFDPQIQDINGTDQGALTYWLEPRNALLKGKPYERLVVKPSSTYQPTGLRNECAFTALWGWTTYPRIVIAATRIQSSRFFNRANSPYGVAGSPDQGTEMRLLDRVDPDVAAMLRTVKRQWAAAG